MFGQLDTVRHPLVIATLMIAIAATADDIALAPLMTGDGIGIALVVVFEDLQAHLPRSLKS